MRADTPPPSTFGCRVSDLDGDWKEAPATRRDGPLPSRPCFSAQPAGTALYEVYLTQRVSHTHPVQQWGDSPPPRGFPGTLQLRSGPFTYHASRNTHHASHIRTAIHRQDLTGNKARPRTSEENDRFRDLFWLPQPAHRRHRLHLVQGSRGHGLDHVSLDKPWRYRIDRNAFARQFTRQTFREGNNGPLRSGVVGLAEIASLADNRRDIDNPPPARSYHILRYQLGGKEYSVQVDLPHLVPHRFSHFQKRSVPRDACVVDQDRDRSKFPNYLFHHVLHLVRRSHICLVSPATDAVLFDDALGQGLRRFFRGLIRKRHVSAGTRHRCDDRPPNPSAPSRNQTDLAPQFHMMIVRVAVFHFRSSFRVVKF